MKIFFAILIVISYACLSEAILKHLKAKLKLSPFIPPAAGYRYVTSPVPIAEPVPVVHSSPVSIISSHTSTYSTVPHRFPSYAVYKSPIFSAPIEYDSVIAIPFVYEEPPLIHYEEPAIVSLEASAL